jgi:nucleoside-diphosphate-sugar epimerase
MIVDGPSGVVSGRRAISRILAAVRVLVTGGTGFVGSHAAAAFLRAGHDVRLLVRTPAKVAPTFAPFGLTAEQFEVAPGDMTDEAAVKAALEGCDAVLHAAAAVGVASGDTSPTAANVDGTRIVVGSAVAAGCDPVLYTSSVAVLYPPSEPVLTAESPLQEPISEYGRSKVAAERYVRSLQADGAPVVSFLIGGVYGPDQPQLDSAMTSLVAATSQAMVITKGGVGVLDVRDLAAAFVAALEPGRGPRRYLVGGRYHTWQEWTDVLDEVVGRRVRRVRVPAPLMTGLARVLDAAKRVRYFDYPLTYEAAIYMTSAVPQDDTATRTDLGIEYRPTTETFADCLRWLVAAGHLDAKHVGTLLGRS